MNTKKIKIGLFGFGCVGKGLYDVLKTTPGLKAEIKKICIRDEHKNRSIDRKYFTSDKEVILNDPEINVVVELIDDSGDAFEIVAEALKRGKAVVTANKKMISENIGHLLCLQGDTSTPLLYEAACCASIPLIRNFEEYYDNDLLQAFSGIMNGTTNFILTDMFNNDRQFAESLGYARVHGYTESDPVLDLEGYDSKYKLNILMAHAFGLILKPEDIFNFGIRRINSFDMQFIREKGGKIKLSAKARKLASGGIAAFVMPEIIYRDNELFIVDGVDNGIVTENYFSDKNIFIGKGAGAFPTAAAVLSDLSALSYDYKYEYKKKHQAENIYLDKDFYINVYIRYNRHNEFNLNEMEELYEKYDSKTWSYITGKINFQKLLKPGWIDDKSVNVMLLNDRIMKDKRGGI